MLSPVLCFQNVGRFDALRENNDLPLLIASSSFGKGSGDRDGNLVHPSLMVCDVSTFSSTYTLELDE